MLMYSKIKNYITYYIDLPLETFSNFITVIINDALH